MGAGAALAGFGVGTVGARGEGRARLRKRVTDELKTTFASHYTSEISLAQALDLDTLRAYNKRATGEKYLINPAL